MKGLFIPIAALLLGGCGQQCEPRCEGVQLTERTGEREVVLQH